MNYYLTLAILLFGYMSLWFVISLIRKRNDVADIAWGLGFVLLAWTGFFLARDYNVRAIIVNILVSLWGFRLAWHIFMRNRGKAEDYRYQAWRKEWGKWFYLRSFAQVYLLQGLFLFLIALPVSMVNRNFGVSLGWLDILGVAVWLLGFCFESIGDAQLAKFIHDPKNKGQLMQRGLWAYTRHPNYFGEVTQWWGLWLLALAVPGGWVAVLGPLTITILILKVSGIPLLEKKMAQNPAFAAYKKRVSVFFPLPPRRAR